MVLLLIYITGYFVIVVSLIPLIRNDNWIFRAFEYPRAQKLYINIILLVAFAFAASREDTHALLFGGLLTANGIYLFYQVFPYTVLAKHQMKGRKVREKGKHFKLLVCNVYQENRRPAGCIACIRQHQPDLVLLVETDSWWQRELRCLEREYPWQVARPLENTYGMILYSRLELVDPQVKYLVEQDVPSIHTRVRLPSGDLFYLYCLHPQPPVPQENPRSTERDAELLTIAKEAKACKHPVIVAGDLNDVAWSYTTELFMKVSGLLDPRRGRGFFNTFNARHWFLRWPLDHIFCSRHFVLIDMKRLPAMGSDHFPILVELGLNDRPSAENRAGQMHANVAEEAVAEEKIARVREVH